MSTFDAKDIAAQIETLVRCTLDLGDDVDLRHDADLIDEVGLDSIEGYEAIAALHSMIGQAIPKNLDPSAIRSIQGMTRYVITQFGDDIVGRLAGLDVRAQIAALRSVDTLE